ncbi:hypothetical protein LZ554_001335 [Drepanopeziza brunnea f. sp. 'monogermtubi']|nr:hypothetical protein LZ554_001335 [Drepanopeziza brunnea f. sp. 'monogermtubi']
MAFLNSVKSLTANIGRKRQKQSKGEAKGILPSLKPVALPRVSPEHVLALSDQGWTTIGLSQKPTDPLHDSFERLLQASQAFFDLPEKYKQTFKTEQGSEEGWSRVRGEKEFITLRTIGNTPDELKDAAETYWNEASVLLNETLGRVAESLNLPAEALTVFSNPCTTLAEEETATMLRLFRYEGFEGNRSEVVAESHADLGLLSLVIGDKPGLEVRDTRANCWFPIEQSYETPKGSLLVGRQLERLSNGRYQAGGHRVCSYPNPALSSGRSTTPRDNYRYSVVLVLRAHLPVPIDTDSLTTGITGPFSRPLKNITADDLFREIHAAHFNINTGIEEREEQKRNIVRLERKS